MAYFRSFTLQDTDLDGVSRVSEWCTGEKTLAEAAREWLDGGLPCEESKRYVQNFMTVVDMRPDGEDAGRKHEDDLFSDEDVD
eukprot:2783033-Pyramimonas_sp.AAC.1